MVATGNGAGGQTAGRRTEEIDTADPPSLATMAVQLDLRKEKKFQWAQGRIGIGGVQGHRRGGS